MYSHGNKATGETLIWEGGCGLNQHWTNVVLWLTNCIGSKYMFGTSVLYYAISGVHIYYVIIFDIILG